MKTMKPKRKRVTFTIKAEPTSTVYLAGTFNHWDHRKKKLKPDPEAAIHSGTLMLEPGNYEYKFVVDGVWMIDPENDDFIRNAYGSLNSVVRVAP